MYKILYKQFASMDLQAILKKKLQLKSEALVVLSKELDQNRIQRDQFKLMAEQIQERFLHLKKQMCDTKESNRYFRCKPKHKYRCK